MADFKDHLWQDLVREHGMTLTRSGGPAPSRPRRGGVLRRPRVLAGSTLGLAGVGAALVLTLGAGGATAPPAFAVTRHADDSVLVKLHDAEAITDANAKLATMGVDEKFLIDMKPGAATVPGPVTCRVLPGGTASGPAIKVIVGNDGTETITPDNSGNSGPGTVSSDRSYHLAACWYEENGASGNTGVPSGS